MRFLLDLACDLAEAIALLMLLVSIACLYEAVSPEHVSPAHHARAVYFAEE